MYLISDRVLLPATGYLHLVWETFAMMFGVEQSKFAVTFEDIKLHRATFLTREEETNLTISIQRGMRKRCLASNTVYLYSSTLLLVYIVDMIMYYCVCTLNVEI
jgi:hypothetical protein